MKKLVLLLILVVSFSSLEAQEYVPFPTDSASWHHSTLLLGLGTAWWSHSSAVQHGDTLINDTIYNKIYFVEGLNQQGPEAVWFFAGGLREDSERKIYFRTSINWLDSSQDFYRTFASFNQNDHEYLIYDFENIQIGDSLHYQNDVYELGGYSYIVQDIDSILINELYRKRYVLEDNVLGTYSSGFGFDTSYFFEGVGSSLGLLAPFKTGEGGVPFNNSQLTCFENQDYTFSNPFHAEVIDCLVGLSVQELSASPLSLYPNPTSQNLSIESSSSPIHSVNIYNQIGELVYSNLEIHLKQVELDLSVLKAGVYFVHVVDANGVHSEKVVINQ